MKLLLCLCLALGAALLPAPGWSQQHGARVALVIGNAYPEATSPLATTIGDARALAAELRRHSFTVDLKENVNKQQMQDAIAAFIGSIRSGAIALFYFSGYGIQADRQTFLIPVNADIWREADVKREGVSIDNVLAEMHRREAKVKILILDGAHRNRFEGHFRANPAGLSAIDTPVGTLTLYSAAPEKLVNDGSGASSVFMSELIKQLRDADLTAEAAFNRVRIAVSRATNNEQVPSVSSTLVEEFRFGPAVDPCAAAADDWRRAEANGSLAPFEDHLARFPDCQFAERARARIDELKKRTTAAAHPVAPAQPSRPAQPAVGITPPAGVAPLSAEQERELKPKEVFKECAACPEIRSAGGQLRDGLARGRGRSFGQRRTAASGENRQALRGWRVSRDRRSVRSLRDANRLRRGQQVLCVRGGPQDGRKAGALLAQSRFCADRRTPGGLPELE